MRRQRRRGRLFLLTCLGVAWLQGGALAQQPSGTPVVATSTPTAKAPPKGMASPKTGSASGTVKATPSSASASASPAPTTPTPAVSPLIPGKLDYSAGSAREVQDWKQAGAVGQSTFMDKLRTMTWTLALICFLVWLVGKFAPKGTLEKFGLPTVESGSLIEVLEKKRMSPGRSILLLRVGPKVLAVAATESGYSTLAELDGEAVKKHLDERAEKAPPETTPSVPSGPSGVAKHYLSIIPGLGAKK